MGNPWSFGTLLAAALTATVAADDSSAFSKASNDSLLWGPYRPNLYFGVRPRLPKSITTGLLWSRVEDFVSVQSNTRYTCEQHEGMAGYGWDAYDARTGGVQVVHDKGNGLDLETSFVKFDEGRGGWGARIKGTPRDDVEPVPNVQYATGADVLKTAVWFTVGAEGLGSVEPQDAEAAEESGYAGDVILEGQTSDLGDFKITITESKENAHPTSSHPSYQNKPLDHTFVHSAQTPEEALWQAKGKSIHIAHATSLVLSV